MDIKKACDLLELNFDDFYKIKKSDIKKKYYKMALKAHPDKNGNTNDSKIHFQNINIAYEYLLNQLSLIDINNDTDYYDVEPESNNNNNDNLNISSVYINILSMCISNLLKHDYKDYKYNNHSFLQVFIKDLLVIGTKLTKEKIFDLFKTINKTQTIEIYSFLSKYKEILYISPFILELVSLVIKQRYKDDLIFVLTPSIDDLLDNNLYKLVVDNMTYVVPLWHTELYFDYNDPITKKNIDEKEIIVFCNPILPENITIEDNNIYYNLLVVFNKQNLLDTLFIEFTIGHNIYHIPTSELKIKNIQYYTLKNKGISKINEHDMYNVSCKGDIIVKIIFQ